MSDNAPFSAFFFVQGCAKFIRCNWIANSRHQEVGSSGSRYVYCSWFSVRLEDG